MIKADTPASEGTKRAFERIKGHTTLCASEGGMPRFYTFATSRR
jgi:hypothetical protein